MTPSAARRSAIAAATATGTLYRLTEDERVHPFRIWAATRPDHRSQGVTVGPPRTPSQPSRTSVSIARSWTRRAPNRVPRAETGPSRARVSERGDGIVLDSRRRMRRSPFPPVSSSPLSIQRFARIPYSPVLRERKQGKSRNRQRGQVFRKFGAPRLCQQRCQNSPRCIHFARHLNRNLLSPQPATPGTQYALVGHAICYRTECQYRRAQERTRERLAIKTERKLTSWASLFQPTPD